MSEEKEYAVISDLHLEFRQGKEKVFWEAFPKDLPEVCLCAGDLTSLGMVNYIYVPHFIQLCARFKQVIYVPGNHEYYGRSPASVDAELQYMESQLPKLKVLRTGEAYTYEGQRFIGDTMWFPDRPEVHIHRKLINDSIQIKTLFPWCFTHSSLFLNYLRSNIQEDDIIITHHVPTDVDTNPIWKKSDTQAYFLNRNCELFLENANTIKPKVWIYGHTHDKHDYKVGRTHFICNPIGYPGENGHMPEACQPCVFKL